MAKYTFLTDEWIDEARRIREEHSSGDSTPTHTVRMNQIVTAVPFGEGQLETHLDTTNGTVELGRGHLDDPDLTVTLDYETAKAILAEGNPQAGMQAMMAGKIVVDGDITKLMALAGAPDPAAVAIAEAIREMTA